jgi:LuxR family maltose regulon positive regulatory protein
MARRESSGASAPVAEGLPFVETKILPPRPRGGLVERERVLATFDSADGASLTLVSAPTGYGKTTAARTWCDARGAAFAWVTLDPADNDPIRLWTYVATAADRIRDGLGRLALRRLGVPGTSVEAAVDELANGLLAYREPVVLVLDDLQAVVSPESLASLEYAVERLPANVSVLAITRADPAIRLGLLRGRGSLAELRSADLAFTPDEARELLVEREGIQLDDAEVSALVERTEGWPAGLYLAALWLRSLDDPSAGVREFTGHHRHVADYLSSEVLDALDDDVHAFLLRSAVLGRFTAELCDAVLERDDSAEKLEALERSNLFLVALDGQGRWFRYHSLFAELLALELEASEPGAAVELHRRAGAWLRERGLTVEAAEHAAAAGDYDVIADLLVESHVALIRHGRPATFLHWVSILPEHTLVERPVLPAAAAIAGGLVGRPGRERRRYLELVSRARRERPDAFGPYVSAAAALGRVILVDGDVGEAVAAGRVGAALLAAEPALEELSPGLLGGLSHALYLAGENEEAEAVARRVVDGADPAGRPHGYAVSLATLALVAADRGSLAAARVHVEAAREIVREGRFADSLTGGNVAAAAAVVEREEGRLAEAEREAQHAERVRRTPEPSVEHAWSLLLLAGVRRRRGRLADARHALNRARDALAEVSDAGRLREVVVGEERELAEAEARAGRGEMVEPPTEAELNVLRLLATDLSLREIGGELFLSVNTVKTHTRGLYRKLGVSSRIEAVARAGALGLLEPESPG